MLRPFHSFSLVLSGILLVYACGGADSKRAVPSGSSAGAADSPADSPGAGAGGADGANNQAGGSSIGEMLGGAPASGAGASGASGTGDGGALAGGAGGAGDAPDTDPPTCNDACEAGACVFDTCLGTTSVTTAVNLSTSPLTAERQCAEAPAYAVTSLLASSATLSAVATGCLAVGDEVLLINLQGSIGATANVGAWELLKLSGVDADTVTFESAKLRHYGGASNTDDGIGTGAAQQRVALVRVPRFGVLDIPALATLTANAWDGQVGGVIALRAGQVHLAGKIDASALGYRPGRFSQDDSDCSDSVATEAGESIAGMGAATTLANFGASGGLGAGTGTFNSNSPLMTTPGHATAGADGANFGTRTPGGAGDVYGNRDGTRLTLGSGPGGGLTCDAATHEPALTPLFFGHAGGIVLVLADEVTLTETGSISASPPQASRDIAFAGGYVLIRGQSLSLGSEQVTAVGGVGKGVNGPTVGLTNQAGDGYVTLDAPSITGSTTPAATLLQ